MANDSQVSIAPARPSASSGGGGGKVALVAGTAVATNGCSASGATIPLPAACVERLVPPEGDRWQPLAAKIASRASASADRVCRKGIDIELASVCQEAPQDYIA